MPLNVWSMRGAHSSQVSLHSDSIRVLSVSVTVHVHCKVVPISLVVGCMQEWAGFAQMLAAGIYGGHMAQAAELLAFAKPNWRFKARAQRMFLDIIHPACSLFCGRTSDSPPLPRPQTCEKGANGNWCVLCYAFALSSPAGLMVVLLAATIFARAPQCPATQGCCMHERSRFVGSVSR